MEYVFLWLVFAAATAAIYRRKGRSVITGILGGLLLGPIGLILALVSGEAATCPHCRGGVHPEATVCRHCGRAIT